MRNAGAPWLRERLPFVARTQFETEQQLRERAERAVRLLTLLTEVTAELGGAHAEADVLDVVRRRVGLKLEASGVALWALTGGQLQQLTADRLATRPLTPRRPRTQLLLPSRGLPPLLGPPAPEPTPEPAAVLSEGMGGRASRVLRGHAAAAAFAGLPIGGRVAVLPLTLAERVVGVLQIAWQDAPQDLETHAYTELLEALASQVAQALDRAWLYESERIARQEAEGAARRLRLQQDLSHCLADSVGVVHLSVAAVDFAVTSLRSAGAALLQVDDRRRALRLLATFDVPVLDARVGVLELSDTGPCSVAVRTRTPVVQDLPLDSVPEPSQLLALPLVLRDRVIGVLALVRAIVDPIDPAFLAGLTQQCAVALERVQLHDATREKTRALQRHLLPSRIPQIPGVDLALRYRPAGRQDEVGGDFYDIFAIDDDTWGILIGDVSGKGAAAASLTALARYTVRTAARREASLPRLLGLLNEAVLDATAGDDRFCTVAYLEVSTGPEIRVRVVVGGHPLPLHRDLHGVVRPVGQEGLALGMLPGLHWADERLTLRPGESLVLYTDGITEVRGPDGAMVEDIVEVVLRDADGSDAEELADRIERLALDGSAGRPRDDLAVLVLRGQSPANREIRDGGSHTATLECDPTSAAAARRAVRAFLRAHHLPQAVEDSALELTEHLVANAVSHAGTAVGLRVLVLETRVRVEVSDGSPSSLPDREAVAAGARTGRGLSLLHSLATTWDVRQHSDRKTVWFELASEVPSGDVRLASFSL